MQTVDDVGATVLKAQNGTPVRVRDIAVVTQGAKIRLGKLGKAIHRSDGKIIDDDDVVEGIVLLRKGADADKVLVALHDKVDYVNRYVLPPGVRIVPYLDRSELVTFTTHTVLHNLGEGITLVVIILFLFLGNIRSAFIVALTIPFSLLFASILLDLRHIPANLLSLGALDFGMVVDGSVVMVENILRHLHDRRNTDQSLGETIRRRARGATPGFLRHCHHHHCLPSYFHVGACRRTVVPSDGVDGGVCPAGRNTFRHSASSRARQFFLSRRDP